MEEGKEQQAPGPTSVAKSVRRISSAVVRAVSKRDRLPHQLFWSLFKTEVASIKERKEVEREKRKVWLLGSDTE